MGSQPRGISASRGAAVLGLSEYQTPLEVFQRIMEEREPGWNASHGYALPPESDSAAMRWGTAFESAVIELAERAQGKKIVERELMFARDAEKSFTMGKGALDGMDVNKKHFITCHVDGIYNEKLDSMRRLRLILHEGKTTSAFTFRNNWGEPGTDHIPTAYQVQVQHQMLCTGAEEAIVSVLVFPETPDKWEAMGWEPVWDERAGGFWALKRDVFPNIDTQNWANTLNEMGYFHQYPVRANPDAQRLTVEKYREFWHNNVLTGTPPEARNYEDVKRLFPEPKSTIVAPDYIERKIAEYKGITEETANAKKRKERLKTIITKYAATHAGIEDDESAEAVIFRNGSGDKLASWSKDKNGKLVFRC